MHTRVKTRWFVDKTHYSVEKHITVLKNTTKHRKHTNMRKLSNFFHIYMGLATHKKPHKKGPFWQCHLKRANAPYLKDTSYVCGKKQQKEPLLVMLLDRDLMALTVIWRPNLEVDPSTLLYYPFLILCVLHHRSLGPIIYV